MSITTVLILIGLIYSGIVSWLAYRQSGKNWMLFFPQWIDAKSGVSRTLRWHGFIAFAILFAGVALLLLP